MARHLNMPDKLVSDDRVIPGFDLTRLEDILQDHPDVGALMLVGHEPDFSNVVGRLVGGRIIMKKGGIAYVECAEASLEIEASLVWLVTSRSWVSRGDRVPDSELHASADLLTAVEAGEDHHFMAGGPSGLRGDVPSN